MGASDKNNSDMRHIRDRVRKLRIDSGLQQSEIADAIGMSRSVYVKRETGESDFKVAEIIKLAEFYEKNNKTGHPIDCHWLLTGEQRENISAHEATGLSDDAISNIQNMRWNEKILLNELLAKDRFSGFLSFWAEAVDAAGYPAPIPGNRTANTGVTAVPIIIPTSQQGYFTVAAEVASDVFTAKAVDTLKDIMREITVKISAELREEACGNGNPRETL